MSTELIYDVVVIGGGINGTGIAADAAGRGLSVLLCEQNDLGSATSSASSKLIHGGLRYLEYFDFGLVRESLQERRILLKSAPHLVRPMRFVVPYNKLLRPFWIIRLGLFLYDLMGQARVFKRSKTIYFNTSDPYSPLNRTIRKGFIYSDCFGDDARLVLANALRAERSGAEIAPRTRCLSAERHENEWRVLLENTITKQHYTIKANALINATGPWVEECIKSVFHMEPKHHIRLVKGSHIIVPKLYDREQAYVLQHKDGRVVFVIPYLKQFTLIGTTDVDFHGDPLNVKIDFQEKEYLCELVSEYFHHPLKPQQILYSWSGVRPLIDEKANALASLNRGYKLELNISAQEKLPLINVFGGKLTTYRILAEKALDMLTPFFSQAGSAWTAKRPLPGGDLPDSDLTAFLEKLAVDFQWLPSSLLMRYAHSYGTLTYSLLQGTKDISDLGEDLGHGLYEKEVIYLLQKEWARTAEDILWRRSKLGLNFSAVEQEKLKIWLEKNAHDYIEDAKQIIPVALNNKRKSG
ncbi:MAG: glycerol-3-phosphate dehydrogenase [Gammaproteobacteria bacterium 39-13]|mgnify:CR=1 FL=1|nr:glycerol-3-phosphate dehydrogenase [Gammaproteobacteria bacterium]OJV89023.1 MAG: glycerol-3-phosphate dehydrogenase [Gammaproteobacteria bacterium 39-13]